MDKLTIGPPALPGGISVTHLRVYDSTGPDGLCGGSAHMHFACTEAYFVLSGEGAVQTLSGQGYRETPLRKGAVVWFTPGVIHRLINFDKRLEIYVVMENQGLPEHGDSVLSFPDEYLESVEKYLEFASLSPKGAVYANDLQAATRRRDLAVAGFVALRKQVESEGPRALHAFHERAVNLMRSKEPEWRKIWESGPAATIRRTEKYLDSLHAASSDYLSQSAIFAFPPEAEARKLGFCGTLRPYLPEGIIVAAQDK
jgi:mannose-6-phosphate isomerase-like protein (cupin superfamily)